MIVNSSSGEENDKDEPYDPKERDSFGCTRGLRHVIKKKYEMLEVLGKGSYGTVSKGKCRQTGRIVALKVMEN